MTAPKGSKALPLHCTLLACDGLLELACRAGGRKARQTVAVAATASGGAGGGGVGVDGSGNCSGTAVSAEVRHSLSLSLLSALPLCLSSSKHSQRREAHPLPPVCAGALG